uniref:Tetraspanin n=1 Tax=Macrostomum lignano TaxID=282301 RepID=A0A1I8J561_9PLAT
MGVCSCCTSCLAKSILGIVNSVFMTVGILLTIFGALFYWGQQAVYNWISSMLAKSDVGSTRQISLEEIQAVLGAWSRYLTYAGVILFGLGIALVGLAIIGYIGMCCEFKVLVIAYTVTVGAFGVGCIGVVISYGVFKKDMVHFGRTEMLKLLRQRYNNSGTPNEFTTILDLIQARMPCCGVDNYTDFYNATGWNRTYIQDKVEYNLTAPISCCMITGPSMRPDYPECVSAPNSNNSNYMVGGCYGKLWAMFDNYSAYTMYALGVTAAVCTIGVAIAALGCVLHFGGNAVYQAFSSLLGSIGSTNIGGEIVQLGILDLQRILGSWSSIISYAGLILLGLGLFFLAVGILGCIGACCNLKTVLIVYAILTLTITVVLIGFVIGYYVLKQNMRDLGAEEMRKLIVNEYQGRTHPSPNDFSKILDIVQGQLDCCGVTNYTEFYSAGQWNRTYYYSDSVGYIQLTAPIACCKLRKSDFEPQFANCTLSPTAQNSNIHTACYDKLWEFLDTYANVLIVGIAITAGVTAGISVLAIIMLCYHFKNDVTPI